MQMYVILRRGGWKSPADLQRAAQRGSCRRRGHARRHPLDPHYSRRAGARSAPCASTTSSPEAIRKHAKLADLPVDEIIAIADTVIINPDPVAVAAE